MTGSVAGSGAAHGDERRPASAIGVDVGASRLKLALVDQTGAVLRSSVHPTPHAGTGAEIVDDISSAILAFRDDGPAPAVPPRGTGIVVPHFSVGPDWAQRWTNNMGALEGLAIRPLLTKRLGGEIAIANDVSAATVAEHMFGLGRGVDRLLLMAIGTGISIGVIIDGELLQYMWGTAGDTGHIVVDINGMHECTCGARGCLETVASGTGIRDAAVRALRGGEASALAAGLEAGRSISAADVAEAARQGDPVSVRIFERAAFYLGVALASFSQVFCPQLIVLAGGVTASSDLWLDRLRQSLKEIGSPARLSSLQGVELSAFPHMGAAIGSASLIMYPGRYLRDRTPTESQVDK
jgi:glucokinase